MSEGLFDKIAVRPPYFALENIELVEENLLKAEIFPEQIMYNETGIIAAAEAGRHLAILGSCASSLKNTLSGKFYYLAVQADLKRITYVNTKKNLFATAKVISVDKRNSHVITALYSDEGEQIFVVEIKYVILHEKIFEKLFARFKNENSIPTKLISPFSQEIKLENIIFEENKLTLEIPPVKPEQCAGHFPGYEAVPVAILMHSLSRAAGMLAAEIFGVKNLKYTVAAGKIKAENLAFAGNKVKINVEYIKSKDYFVCEAFSQMGILYGKMDLYLRTDSEQKKIGTTNNCHSDLSV